MGKVHAQLRRLRNESSLLDDAIITAIPSYKSKVLFIPTKVKDIYRGVEYYLQPSVVADTTSLVSLACWVISSVFSSVW